MVRQTLGEGRFVVTVEEGVRMGGFGSAFTEAAIDGQLDSRNLRVLALPDKFIEHGDRNELLHDHGLSPEAIAQTCRQAAGVESLPSTS
jgi:1-deoxy-D-xylulose-5-phosphate synthase